MRTVSSNQKAWNSWPHSSQASLWTARIDDQYDAFGIKIVMTINMNDKENMRMETTRVVDLNLLAQFSIPSKNSKAVLNIWIEQNCNTDNKRI